MIKYSELFDISFQIGNDVFNYTDPHLKGREGDDITDGKKSLIILRACQRSDKASRLIDILKQRTSNREIVREALDIIYKTDAITYAKAIGEKYNDDAYRIIDKLFPESEAKKEFFIHTKLYDHPM